ncbi:branched-chain amino acid transport system II carrier protein [Peribacillus frigoritolerans]|nr:branched-chain amino acid transport system II carrier protein [Peribacillus frigoritolerans]
MLGQSAGTNIWSANAGFFGHRSRITVTWCAGTRFFLEKDDLQSLASRVHPVFGIVFTTVLYLAIGPLFRNA